MTGAALEFTETDPLSRPSLTKVNSLKKLGKIIEIVNDKSPNTLLFTIVISTYINMQGSKYNKKPNMYFKLQAQKSREPCSPATFTKCIS